MKKLELKAIDFFQAVNHDKSETQFRNPSGQYVSVANAVSIAQAKHDAFMQELINGAKVVYASEFQSWQWTNQRCSLDTHTALLIDVKEIENKCEKHSPMNVSNGDGYNTRNICRNCGIELEIQWVAK